MYSMSLFWKEARYRNVDVQRFRKVGRFTWFTYNRKCVLRGTERRTAKDTGLFSHGLVINTREQCIYYNTQFT